MPVQRRLFGRNIPVIHPRKVAIFLATITLFAVITLVFTLPNSIPSGPSLSTFADHKLSIPKLPSVPRPHKLNPFKQPVHPPKAQKNSTSGDTSWYSDWNWLNPFSSTVTLDTERALLPPLRERPPIYTYYDSETKRSKAFKEAENELLVTWRRAWWSQGFNPIIIGPAEAVSNPLYKELQLKELSAGIKLELQKWLAWEQMGTGILCSHLTLPMSSRDDFLLTYLRRGEYPLLTRYEKLGSGLFSGSKGDITLAVKQALHNKHLDTAKEFIQAVDDDTFRVESRHDGVAYYNPKTFRDRYPRIADKVVNSNSTFVDAAGLKLLHQMIESHLHSTWQNIYTQGIAVLKPFSEHTTYMVSPAHELAQYLIKCPDSPLPSSCPPNRPQCKPCVATSPMRISTPPWYKNESDLFTIGTIPHPYTNVLLTFPKINHNATWIRRKSDRDPWLFKVTQLLLGTGITGSPRVVKLKDAIASEQTSSRSLWFVAEEPLPTDLSWVLGFNLPENSTLLETGKSETPVPGPERRPKPIHDAQDGVAPPDELGLEEEKRLLEKAIAFGEKSKKVGEEKKLRMMLEAWNMADTEAWHFVRAYNARRTMERLQWEEEEKKYGGGAGAEHRKKGGLGRWFDD